MVLRCSFFEFLKKNKFETKTHNENEKNTNAIEELSTQTDGKSDSENKETSSKVSGYSAIRCVFLAESYRVLAKYPEAFALFSRAQEFVDFLLV